MSGKKATTTTKTPINHLEAALGFITGSRGLSRISEHRRAPEVTKLLNRLTEICIELFNDATPDGLRADKNLEAVVTALLEQIGAILWPDFVPSWAFDPSDHKQSALNKLAKWYPKQLRYSNAAERDM